MNKNNKYLSIECFQCSRCKITKNLKTSIEKEDQIFFHFHKDCVMLCGRCQVDMIKFKVKK